MSPTLTFNSLMMPLAFDLISTFVIGSMRPVATTERAMSPRSTAANREESISVVGRDITTKPVTPNPLRMTSAPNTHNSLRDFFFIIRLHALLTFESRIDQQLFRFPYGVLEKTVPKMICDDGEKRQPSVYLKIRGGSIHHLITLSECREGAKCCSRYRSRY